MLDKSQQIWYNIGVQKEQGEIYMIDLMSIIFILLAWFVEMPLWLSIVLTVLSGIRAIMVLIDGIYKTVTENEFTLFRFF